MSSQAQNNRSDDLPSWFWKAERLESPVSALGYRLFAIAFLELGSIIPTDKCPFLTKNEQHPTYY